MTLGIEETILTRLKEREEKEGSLPGLVEMYRQLLLLQDRVKLSLRLPELSLNKLDTDNRIKRGIPLVSFDELQIDWTAFCYVFEDVSRLVSSHQEIFENVPEHLEVFDSKSLHKIVKSWFCSGSFPEEVAITGINQNLLGFMINATIKPYLILYRDSYMSHVEQNNWRRAYCPICGARPDFAFLERKQGARWLLCSRCDTEWLFQRLECPFCGCQDQDDLSCYTDDKGLRRLYVCDKCGKYLKAVDLRQTDAEVLLPLERLLTIHIDIQARNLGYASGTVSQEHAD